MLKSRFAMQASATPSHRLHPSDGAGSGAQPHCGLVLGVPWDLAPQAPWGWCKKQEMALGDWREPSQGSGWVINTLMRGDGRGSESSKAPGTRLQGHPQLSPLARGDSHQCLIAYGIKPRLMASRYPILLIPRAFSLK